MNRLDQAVSELRQAGIEVSQVGEQRAVIDLDGKHMLLRSYGDSLLELVLGYRLFPELSTPYRRRRSSVDLHQFNEWLRQEAGAGILTTAFMPRQQRALVLSHVYPFSDLNKLPGAVRWTREVGQLAMQLILDRFYSPESRKELREWASSGTGSNEAEETVAQLVNNIRVEGGGLNEDGGGDGQC